MIPCVLTPPTFDVTAPFPEVKRWRAAIAAGDWPALAAAVTELPDADSREFAVRQIGRTARAEHFLSDVVARTGDTLALLLLASRQIELGWAARGAGSSKATSRKRFARFHEHLAKAEPLLAEVTARKPEDAPAWVLRLVTARGLQMGQAEAWRRYRQVVAHHPHHYPAQTQMLQQLAPKWGGTWDSMYRFARDCAEAAPPGAVNQVLVAEAHIERWLNAPGNPHFPKPVRTPQVRDELSEAARASVLHPAFRRDYRYFSAHSTFALALTVAGGYALSAPHFRAAGRYHAGVWWGYYPLPSFDLVFDRAVALMRG